MEIILDGGVRRGWDSEAMSETAIFHVDLLVNVANETELEAVHAFSDALVRDGHLIRSRSKARLVGAKC